MKAQYIIGINDVAKLISIKDHTSRVIKSHLIIEHLLDCLLAESINTTHQLELRKITFSLKLDICYALIPPLDKGIKPVLLKINKIRNQFAHNRNEEFDNKKAIDLLNIVPTDYKTTFNCFKNAKLPIEVWHACFYSCYIILNMTFDALAKYKVSQELFNAQIDELLLEMKPYLKKIKKDYSKARKSDSKKNKTGRSREIQEIFFSMI